jgi:hypothetical protein
MANDPFGNLNDWGPILETIEELAANGRLADHQTGLTRILRYKGNWRLREEVLKRVAAIETPSKELAFEVLALMADDNIYYDARILAGSALLPLLDNQGAAFRNELHAAARKVVQKITSTPQPPFFEKAVEKVGQRLAL